MAAPYAGLLVFSLVNRSERPKFGSSGEKKVQVGLMLVQVGEILVQVGFKWGKVGKSGVQLGFKWGKQFSLRCYVSALRCSAKPALALGHGHCAHPHDAHLPPVRTQ